MQFALEQSGQKPRAWKGHRAPWVAAPSLSRKRRAAEGGGNWSCLIPQVAEPGQPDAASSHRQQSKGGACLAWRRRPRGSGDSTGLPLLEDGAARLVSLLFSRLACF